MSWAGLFQYDIGKSRNAQQVPAEVVFDDQVPTLLCLSHLRWSFVYQRPQHLMSRFARDYNVLFHEEPIPTEDAEPWLEVRPEENGVQVLILRLPAGCEGRMRPACSASCWMATWKNSASATCCSGTTRR